MCTLSNISKMAYFRAAYAVHVTIPSTDGKFQISEPLESVSDKCCENLGMREIT